MTSNSAAACRAGRRNFMLVLPVLGALALAACSTDDAPQIPKGMSCVDDSQHCISERNAALGTLMADKQRGWVRQPASLAAYASGVRLFAYKQKKRELNCEELAIGRKEAEAGPATLRGPQGKVLSTAQLARSVMLAQEVHRELDIEFRKRCGV